MACNAYIHNIAHLWCYCLKMVTIRAGMMIYFLLYSILILTNQYYFLNYKIDFVLKIDGQSVLS